MEPAVAVALKENFLHPSMLSALHSSSDCPEFLSVVATKGLFGVSQAEGRGCVWQGL